MAANNLVTSRYLHALRTAALEDRLFTPTSRTGGTPGTSTGSRTPGPGGRTPGGGGRTPTVHSRTPGAAALLTPGPAKGCSSASTSATRPPDENGDSSGPGPTSLCPTTPGSNFERGRKEDDEGSQGSHATRDSAVCSSPAHGLEVSLERFRYMGVARRQAHCPMDVLLCWKMCVLMGLESNVPDVFILMLFRSTKLLHRCGYHTQDIVTLGSYAVVYAVDVLAQHLGTMDWQEAANMVGLQFFLAHTYLMDEHCPMKTWHKHIFSQYCEMPVLCRAAMQLMRARGWLLRLPESGVQRIQKELLTAVHNYRWNPTILDQGARYPR